MSKLEALKQILNAVIKLEQDAVNTTIKVNLTILNAVPDENPQKDLLRNLLMRINHITGESGMYSITVWRPTSKGGKYTRKVIGLLKTELEALINAESI